MSIQFKRALNSNITSYNPKDGEVVLDFNARNFKVGDSNKSYNELEYWINYKSPNIYDAGSLRNQLSLKLLISSIFVKQKFLSIYNTSPKLYNNLFIDTPASILNISHQDITKLHSLSYGTCVSTIDELYVFDRTGFNSVCPVGRYSKMDSNSYSSGFRKYYISSPIKKVKSYQNASCYFFMLLTEDGSLKYTIYRCDNRSIDNINKGSYSGTYNSIDATIDDTNTLGILFATSNDLISFRYYCYNDVYNAVEQYQYTNWINIEQTFRYTGDSKLKKILNPYNYANLSYILALTEDSKLYKIYPSSDNKEMDLIVNSEINGNIIDMYYYGTSTLIVTDTNYCYALNLASLNIGDIGIINTISYNNFGIKKLEYNLRTHTLLILTNNHKLFLLTNDNNIINAYNINYETNPTGQILKDYTIVDFAMDYYHIDNPIFTLLVA